MTREEFWDEFKALAGDRSSRGVAKLLATNWSTVARWMNREHAPPLLSRQAVLALLRQAVEKAR